MDPRIDEYVTEMLARGTLWPEAVLQLNPAFEMDLTLGETGRPGLCWTEENGQVSLDPNCGSTSISEKLSTSDCREHPTWVTTSTGSGKSLTYLLPIYDAVIRNDPSEHSVRALLIYPMKRPSSTARWKLCNVSTRRNWPDSPVRFASYTGQTSEEERNRIQQEPPHILLTNYVNGRVPAAASQRTFDAANGDQQPAKRW